MTLTFVVLIEMSVLNTFLLRKHLEWDTNMLTNTTCFFNSYSVLLDDFSCDIKILLKK